MNAGPDVERLIADWLVEEAASGAPDRVLDGVRSTVDRTRQRRALAAWRPTMQGPLVRVALAAAAIVIAAGAAVWIARPPSPEAGASPTPAPSPPAAALLSISPSGLIEPGTFRIGEPFALDVTMTLPSSNWAIWSPRIAAEVAPFYKLSPGPPGLGIVINRVTNLYVDPCAPAEGLLDPPLGPTVDDLVAAVSEQPGTVVSTATDITLSGHPGRHLEYAFTPQAGCSSISRWPSPFGDRQAIPHERDELWILDVDGTRWVIDLFSFDSTAEADLEEARAVVEGMVIRP